MPDVKWMSDDIIAVAPPKKPLKITGTRFGAILGVNKWNSPFKAWCEITRTYKEPFEDTKYTLAGKVIEPKQAEYMKRNYAMYSLKTPSEVFGADYFKTTHGDFFPEDKVFGGMWDYILTDANGKPTAVLEMKTSKRVEDWSNDIPEYYALQGALYAYLLGVDQVYMVATFLQDADYEHPDAFECSVKNTIVIPFKVSERYPDWIGKMKTASQWWNTHVEMGISPRIDLKRDADIVRELKTNRVESTDIAEVVAKAEMLKERLDKVKDDMAEDEKQYKALLESIRSYAEGKFGEASTNVVIKGSKYSFELAKTARTVIDTAAMQADGLLEMYQKTDYSYRMVQKLIKEDKK